MPPRPRTALHPCARCGRGRLTGRQQYCGDCVRHREGATPRAPDSAAPLTSEALTLTDLWLWLDTITRQYGTDLPLYVQGGAAAAAAELCLDAHVQRGPGGERVIVLSAQALPHREKGAHLS